MSFEQPNEDRQTSPPESNSPKRAGDSDVISIEERIKLAEFRETQSQKALLASELSYRRLFEAAKDGILILDVDSGRINDVNPFLEDLLGFSHEEMIGKTVGELSPFRDIESNKDMLERLQTCGYVRYDNLPLETRDGRHIAVEFVSNVYQAGDKKVVQCNVRDITVRKKVDDEIKRLNSELEQKVHDRTAMLQETNQELEAFTYSVSHDLRAPLRHILGFIDILKEDAGPALFQSSLAHLATISKAATRMGHLIDDLLAFSHLGRKEIQKKKVSLDSLVREALNDSEPDSKNRNISWKIGALPEVWVDRSLLKMVFVNLISNALKFTSHKEITEIEIGYSADKTKGTIIFIRDNGVGFEQLHADKLFGVFQRLHSQQAFEGTGIGLANVQRIVHRHSGHVWAESIVDSGATFYFSIPDPQGDSSAP